MKSLTKKQLQEHLKAQDRELSSVKARCGAAIREVESLRLIATDLNKKLVEKTHPKLPRVFVLANNETQFRHVLEYLCHDIEYVYVYSEDLLLGVDPMKCRFIRLEGWTCNPRYDESFMHRLVHILKIQNS